MSMPNKILQWQDKGYHLLLVEAKPRRFNLLVSRDGESYAIYDRLGADSLFKARQDIQFDPRLYELIPSPFPISRERALHGETGIPSFEETKEICLRAMKESVQNDSGIVLESFMESFPEPVPEAIQEQGQN